jgi:hypothetical protein
MVMARQLDEFGAQLADLRRGTRGQRFLAGTATDAAAAPPGLAATATPPIAQRRAGRLALSPAAGHGERAPRGSPPQPAAVAEGVLGHLIGEIQRGLEERQRVEMQRELLLDLVAGRPLPQQGRQRTMP